MTAGPVHVRLELRSDGEAIWGRAISDESSREFHGWLGLIGAIEALCPAAASPRRPAAPRARSRPR